MRKPTCFTVSAPSDFFSKFLSMSKLRRTVAYCLRFKRDNHNTGSQSKRLIHRKHMNYWMVQRVSFSEEIYHLENNKEINPISQINFWILSLMKMGYYKLVVTYDIPTFQPHKNIRYLYQRISTQLIRWFLRHTYAITIQVYNRPCTPYANNIRLFMGASRYARKLLSALLILNANRY